MQRAGLAAAECARRMLGDSAKSVLVMAGPGNNGGDAFEAACHLKDWFFRVTVFFNGDAAKLPPDAKRAHAKWVARNGHTIAFPPDPYLKFDLVVDGLFGIGLTRAPVGVYADAIEYANLLGAPILALDVPSGINADTGAFYGKGDRAAICAARTITFMALKPGLLMLDGVDCSGEIELADLGVSANIDAVAAGRGADQGAGRSVGTDLFSKYLHPRSRNAHKGDMGSVAIIGGASGMTGAALLAGRAALKLGAGRVYCGLVGDGGEAGSAPNPAFDPDQLELMLRPAGSLFEPGFVDSMVVGPGMGHSVEAEDLLWRALAAPAPLVLDADALNLIGHDPALAKAVAGRSAPTLITPHPGEAARLLGRTIAEVQADRIASALELAKRFNCTALLKGAGSVIALGEAKTAASAAGSAKGGRWFINTSGNPGMASAGMGDVLSGMLGTLLGQGWDAEAAMLGAVHLHGCAADACVAEGRGPAGLTASEVTEAARGLFNKWNQVVR